MAERATELRRNTTDAERRLRAALRDRRLQGYKFRRQHPIDAFLCRIAKKVLRRILKATVHMALKDKAGAIAPAF